MGKSYEIHLLERIIPVDLGNEYKPFISFSDFSPHHIWVMFFVVAVGHTMYILSESTTDLYELNSSEL